MTFGRILMNGEREANALLIGARCRECLMELMYHLSGNQIKVPQNESNHALKVLGDWLVP